MDRGARWLVGAALDDTFEGELLAAASCGVPCDSGPILGGQESQASVIANNGGRQ